MAFTIAQTLLSNTETDSGKPWGLALGSVISKDGITYRLMTASGAITAGNAVVLAPTAANPFLVATTTTAGNPLRYGICAVTAAADADVLIAIEGIVFNAVSTGAIAVGDRVETSTVAGRIRTAITGDAVNIFTATLSPTVVATLTVAQQTFAGSLFLDGNSNIPVGGETAIGINMATAQAGLGIGGVRVIGANASLIGIDFVNASTTSITPTASTTYKLAVTTPGAGAGGGLGTALTSTTGASEVVRVFVHF